MLQEIGDAEWFDLQFDPQKALEKYNISLPSLPTEEVQVGFTGLSGRQNLLQAFEFYRHVRTKSELSKIDKPVLLDFGGGWGRVARFFLRDTTADRTFIAETREYSIDLIRETGATFQVIHNKPRPPLPNPPIDIDLVFAYSVFSHLSVEYFHDWTNYLLSLLRPGGHLAFTTRGEFFINHLDHLHKTHEKLHPRLEEHIRRLREMMPMPDEIRRRYRNGEIQFYPIGGSAELTSDFFGETFVPKAYIAKHFPDQLVDFNDAVPSVDQSVVILRRPPA